jgi:hypothetical protein
MHNPLSTVPEFLGIGVARRRALPPRRPSLVVGGFAVLYPPWLAVTAERSFTFLFYLMPAVRFMCLDLATVVTPWVRSLG